MIIGTLQALSSIIAYFDLHTSDFIWKDQIEKVYSKDLWSVISQVNHSMKVS